MPAPDLIHHFTTSDDQRMNTWSELRHYKTV